MRRRDRLEVCKERQVPRVQVASEFVFAISINTLSCSIDDVQARAYRMEQKVAAVATGNKMRP
jgi:hypothetical protein